MKKTLWLSMFAVLATIGSFTVEAQKNQYPKNIIFLIGDGMGTAQIYSGIVSAKGPLNIERSKVIGFHKNHSADNFITDSAAGATAFSTGQKTYNGAIGVDADKNPLPTILEIAEQKGLATGLVATCAIVDATPSSFIAHQPSRKMSEEIAADFLKTDIDLFIGGGRKYFNQRKDGRNLLDELKSKNYQVAQSIDEVAKVKSGKLAGLIAEGDPVKISEGRGDQLLVSTQTALNILKQNKKGFFLMVEGSQIDWGGHANDTQYIVNEMLDFDKAIGEAFDFADKDGNTLVIITADHETGGFSLNGLSKDGKVEGKFTTGGHTAVMIPVFAYGKGAEMFAGFYKNNDIFDKLKKAFNFK
ncbi:alkaline phosphatase [Emticicia sp. 21SJ11W-3]|uniref:alkaline phosphatase n=1 Tax=Emticicia sp. 21SJ11W-3 TaxID=2916755 RepID=UPI00209D09FE|nr:alkaline phosphatase [Emticicia sp. 21SJ11W-3]UTA67691.1 alkaline phosphatase [Emticicia sp. 21SJ11W-3]